MKNPIINIARENWDSADAHACASEWLFQLNRLWTEHQSPLTGTAPNQYRDLSGPLGLTHARESGEDAQYWDAVLAILNAQGLIPEWDVWNPEVERICREWKNGDVPEGYRPVEAFGHIRVALGAVARIYRLTEEN